MTFFIWVGVVLFNVITGLIVDTFSVLRERMERRAHLLKHECFICGLKRDEYDNANINGAPEFDLHLSRVHDKWKYVLFVSYLKDKIPTDFNGLESFVSRCLKNHNLSWLPTRKTADLRVSTGEKEDPLTALLQAQTQRLERLMSVKNKEGAE